MEQHTESLLLTRLASDDHKAFEALFMKYFPKVKYFIVHLIKSESIAEELSQDIFVKVWYYRKNFNQVKNFNSYIYRMAKNRVVDYFEHQYIEENYLKNHPIQEEVCTEEEYLAKELELLVQLTINNMPPQRSKIYQMSRIEGLKNEEIAQQLNLSKKTVENHLNLALKEIRKTIQLTSLFFI